jgi:hypothetical protein
MHRIAAVAATVAGLLAVPGANAATTTVAPLPGASQALTAYGGWVVWSARAANGSWYLTALHDGKIARLPVAPRPSPFDADAGPDAHGRPTLVYSRCAGAPASNMTAPVPDWATARGCRLFELALGQGHERRLGGLLTGGRTDSDYAPSIWHSEIAFARLVGGTRTARILVYRPGAPLRRLAGGTPGCVHTTICKPSQGHAGALAMDLGPRTLALSWLIRGSNVFGIGDGTELLSVPLDGHANHLAEDGFFAGTCGYRTPNSPNAAGTRVAYLLDSGGDDCAMDSANFQLFSPDGARQAAPVPAVTTAPLAVAAARDGGVTYWIDEIKPNPEGYYGYSDCVTAPSACSLMRSSAIRYQPSPRRRALPPV